VIGDLIAFLWARLAEDEQAARLALDYLAPEGEPAPIEEAWIREVLADTPTDDAVWASAVIVPEPIAPIGEHIARWSPKRVLSEVECTRRIIDRCQRWLAQRPYGTQAMNLASAANIILCDLAARWRHHPDWQHTWEPAPLLCPRCPPCPPSR
jgi:Family of unknown function (DUF6221)